MDYYDWKLRQKWKWKLKYEMFAYNDTYGFVDEYTLEKKLKYSMQYIAELESKVSQLEEHNALLLAKIDSLQKGRNSQEDDHSQDHLETSKMNMADGSHLPLDTMQ